MIISSISGRLNQTTCIQGTCINNIDNNIKPEHF